MTMDRAAPGTTPAEADGDGLGPLAAFYDFHRPQTISIRRPDFGLSQPTKSFL
jgi:hypothetical protein